MRLKKLHYFFWIIIIHKKLKIHSEKFDYSRKTNNLFISFLFTIITTSCLYGQQDLQFLWSGKLGTEGINTAVYPGQILFDNENNKYICGTFKGTHDFDPGTGVYNMTSLDNSINSTVFVLKLDSLNNFIWANYYGTPASTLNFTGMILDSLGNVYTYGSFEGSLYYDPQNSLGIISPFWWYSDVYVHKLNNQGNFEWIKKWGENNTDRITSMIIDDNQDFYLMGSYQSSTDVDPSSDTFALSSSSSSNQFYISKFNSNFDFLWAKQYDVNGSIFYSSLTYSGSNELTIVGEYQGQVDFDFTNGIDIQTSNPYNYDFFVHVIDSNAVTKWFTTLDAPGNQRGRGIVTDDLKNRYIIGSFDASTNFNPSGLPNLIEIDSQSTSQFISETDTYFMKLDSLGNILWTKAIQGANSWESSGLRIDSNQLIIFGTISEKTDIDPSSSLLLVEPINMINYLTYIIKLDTNANLLWHEEIKNSNILTSSLAFNSISDIQFDANNKIILLGNLTGDLDLDPSANIELLHHGIGQATYIAEFNETPCAQLGLYFSDFINGSCSTQGNVTANPIYGNPPYTLNWLTNPPLNSNYFHTDTSGLFFVEITDVDGCKDTNSIFIDGPLSNAGIDLEVNLVRPNFVQGQSNMLWLDAFNRGCQNTNGDIKLVLNSLIQYDSASVPPNIIMGDTLIWNHNFYNNDSSHFTAIIYVTTSQTAVSGDTVCFLAELILSGLDIDTTNNIKNYCDPILASYDPNDVKVYPTGLCNDYVYLNQTLEYTIRFQNTGNYEALNVNIIDTIDQKLDLNTLKIISKSHPNLHVNYTDNNCLQFNFLNIHLPDSLSNPIGSNGYITFSIKPKYNITFNSIISKEVNIYFDYNDPILTNTVSNTITNDIPCVNTDNIGLFENDILNFKIFPNPSNEWIRVSTDYSNQWETISVFNAMGQLILKTNDSANPINVSGLENGLYLISCSNETTTVTNQFIKH